MTSGASAANSAACLRISAALMVAQRVSIRTLWPMVQPDCCSPCRNAPKRVCHTGSSAAAGSSTPMRRTLVAACCARAAKRANPSNYGAGLLTEGAEREGYQLREYGEPDAYGHRKKASVAESLADEIKRRTGEQTMTSDLTYDLRSGDPDFVDKLVGLTFGNMAYGAMLEGKTGVMSWCPSLIPNSGRASWTSPLCRYRPMYANKRGLPFFLQRAL